MARPYSLDLRERVVAQVARGMTHQTVADVNGIISSTLSKWCGRKRASDTPTAKQLLLLVPIAYDVMRYAGAAYLLHLAWQAFATTIDPTAAPKDTSRFSAATLFRQGLLTNSPNPKMALFVLAHFPQFLRADAGA